jgi:integrase
MPTDAVAQEFIKLLNSIDDAAAKKAKEDNAAAPEKLRRPGRSFYALRHTFETIGGESRDQVAVDAIMGHVDSSMAGHYRQRISDERLTAVAECVRTWLFPPVSNRT